MLNLKNNENNTIYDEICKKKAKMKIKFHKNEGYFSVENACLKRLIKNSNFKREKRNNHH